MYNDVFGLTRSRKGPPAITIAHFRRKAPQNRKKKKRVRYVCESTLDFRINCLALSCWPPWIKSILSFLDVINSFASTLLISSSKLQFFFQNWKGKKKIRLKSRRNQWEKVLFSDKCQNAWIWYNIKLNYHFSSNWKCKRTHPFFAPISPSFFSVFRTYLASVKELL